MISFNPIAYVQTSSSAKADLPRQGSLGEGPLAVIRFLPGQQFEQALEDLEGMEKIWVLFWMHQSGNWKPKVQPPRDVKKKGVFATRSPHRPNPIGLSCITLLEVRGLDLWIKDHDFLDQTPILDIKPYLPYADSFPEAKTGWIENEPSSNKIQWNELPLMQCAYLSEKGEADLQSKVEMRLRHFVGPSSSNRIRSLGEEHYIMAYREWRILFQKEEGALIILAILSGYDRVDEVPLHESFVLKFASFFSETFVGKNWKLYSALKESRLGVGNGKDF